MKYEIVDCTIQDIIRDINNMAQNTKPFRTDIYMSGRDSDKHLPWKELDKNVQKFGKKIFDLRIKDKEITNRQHPAYKIPLGNYYIEFYYYRNWGKEQYTVGCIDLKINKNGEITVPGIHPYFMFMKDFRIKTCKESHRHHNKLILWTIKETLRQAIIDRLEQICSKKGAQPEYSLLGQTITYVFKHSEANPGYRTNFKKKINNRIIFINENPDTDNGSWSFDWATNSDGNMSDCLNSDNNMDLDAAREVEAYFRKIDELGIILGEASEQGGMKGNLVFFNEDLQLLRNPSNPNPKAYYQDICYGPSRTSSGTIVPGSVYSIFEAYEKFFARVKSFITSDGCIGHDLKAAKYGRDSNEPIFYRHKNYLDHYPENIGKIDDTTRDTINMLAVFVPSDGDKSVISLDDFRNENKNEYSRKLQGADCHVAISEEASNTLVRVKRVFSEPIEENHVTSVVHRMQRDIKEQGYAKLDADEIIAYKVTCDKDGCNSIMSPIKPPIFNDEGEAVPEPTEVGPEVQHWYCDVCTHNTKVVRPIPMTLRNNFQSALGARVYDIRFDSNDSGLEMDLEIVTPIKISRGVSVEGTKGLTVPMGQDFLGSITGNIYNPVTGQQEQIVDVPVDISMNLGAMKGKLSGMAISHIRMLNAFTGSNLCLDDIYKKNGNFDEANQILEKCQKVTLSRRRYDVDKGVFVYDTQEVYAGVISLIVTEIGDEFLKVKTDVDDMKVSYMNTLFYNWLGLDALNEAMIKSSIEYMGDEENLEFVQELLRMFYGDPRGLTEVFHAEPKILEGGEKDFSTSDFHNDEGRIDLVAWLPKTEWKKALDHHPLLRKGGKFENGAFYTMPNGKRVVFPSRKTIMKLVDVMDSNRVRVHGIVKDAIGIFLDIFTKNGHTDKLGSYRDKIFDKLTGKRGVIARSATYINHGCSGKEIGCGYLPTGVAVIGDEKFWRMAEDHMAKLGIKRHEIDNGTKKLYGTSQRDPFIWTFQALNGIELWTKARADKYFRENYKTDTGKPVSFHEIYPKFNGVLLNVLDMLYLFQTDADGDLRRILVPFDMIAQSEIQALNEAMIDYKFICKADKDSELGKLYSRVEKWHLDYVIDEGVSSAKDFDCPLKISYEEFKVSDRNQLILKNIKAKGNIGIITTSMWLIQLMLSYFENSGQQITVNKDEAPVTITTEIRNAICAFYQTCFVQDGCVRALKGTKDLSKCSFDEIAYNDQVMWFDTDKDEWIGADMTEDGFPVLAQTEENKRYVQDMVRDEAEKSGYSDVVDYLFAVAREWKNIASIDKKNDKVGPDKKKMTHEAEMLKAYIAMCNGSVYGGLNEHEMFERMVIPQSDYIFERKLIEPIAPYLEDIRSLRKKKTS